MARTGANLIQWAKNQEARADLGALFTARQPIMSSTVKLYFLLILQRY